MSEEAAGFSLADTLYRRQAVILGDEAILEAGARLVKHLKRRGYILRYDPAVMEEMAEEFMKEIEPVEVARLAEKPIPEAAVIGSKPAVTLEIDGRDVRCLECGCFTFYVHGPKATCTGCKATYTVRSES